MQKTHGKGSDIRYFWKVTLKGEGAGVYRSRHSNATNIRKEFKKHGKQVLFIVPVKA